MVTHRFLVPVFRVRVLVPQQSRPLGRLFYVENNDAEASNPLGLDYEEAQDNQIHRP
jgi:hypothetical protein